VDIRLLATAIGKSWNGHGRPAYIRWAVQQPLPPDSALRASATGTQNQRVAVLKRAFS
jgi:hypothetical protein